MANEKKNAKTNTTELQAAIQSLIAKGKKEGMIRAADLQAHLDKLDLNPETIEKIYDQLDAMNIQVVAAELDLGDDIDLPAFHHAVLSLGSVPLPVLEQQIHAFIAESQAAAAAP